MLLKRIINGILLIAIFVLCLYLGTATTTLLVFFIIIKGLKEFYRLAEKKDVLPSYTTGISISILIIIYTLFEKNTNPPYFFIAIVLLTLIALLLRKQFKRNSIEDISVTLLGIFYVTFLGSYMIIIRKTPGTLDVFGHDISKGFIYFLFMGLATCFSDTGAFIIGTFLGKRKLWTAVSPGKTIEGSIGGLLMTIIFCVIFGKYLQLSILQSVLLGGLLGIMAQLGDLWESLLKRDADAKDSGSMIAGHGGILDRFDSYLFTAPTFYIIMKIWSLI